MLDDFPTPKVIDSKGCTINNSEHGFVESVIEEQSSSTFSQTVTKRGNFKKKKMSSQAIMNKPKDTEIIDIKNVQKLPNKIKVPRKKSCTQTGVVTLMNRNTDFSSIQDMRSSDIFTGKNFVTQDLDSANELLPAMTLSTKNCMLIKSEYYIDNGVNVSQRSDGDGLASAINPHLEEKLMGTPKNSRRSELLFSKTKKHYSLRKRNSNIYLYHDPEKYDKLLSKEIQSKRKQIRKIMVSFLRNFIKILHISLGIERTENWIC